MSLVILKESKTGEPIYETSEKEKIDNWIKSMKTDLFFLHTMASLCWNVVESFGRSSLSCIFDCVKNWYFNRSVWYQGKKIHEQKCTHGNNEEGNPWIFSLSNFFVSRKPTYVSTIS